MSIKKTRPVEKD